MRYTKEFKLECIKKYKNREFIKDPPGVKHNVFHRQILEWTSIYDKLGEVGIDHKKAKLSPTATSTCSTDRSRATPTTC